MLNVGRCAAGTTTIRKTRVSLTRGIFSPFFIFVFPPVILSGSRTDYSRPSPTIQVLDGPGPLNERRARSSSSYNYIMVTFSHFSEGKKYCRRRRRRRRRLPPARRERSYLDVFILFYIYLFLFFPFGKILLSLWRWVRRRLSDHPAALDDMRCGATNPAVYIAGRYTRSQTVG